MICNKCEEVVTIDNLLCCECLYNSLTDSINAFSKIVHKNAIDKGWYERERNEAELIALIHGEVSECLDACSKGNPDSEKIPGNCHAVEELADAVIRIFDMAESKGWNIGKAIVEKHKYNKTRSYRHGGKKY